MQIKIKPFGVFRKYSVNHFIIESDTPLTVNNLKSKIKENLILSKQIPHDSDIVDKSVLANSTEILAGEFIINEPQELAILPPVCGG